MLNSANKKLSQAQNELYEWIKDYMRNFQHSPSIRQMMQAMGLKSPAPIQSRLRHLQEKGFINWQEGKARGHEGKARYVDTRTQLQEAGREGMTRGRESSVVLL